MTKAIGVSIITAHSTRGTTARTVVCAAPMRKRVETGDLFAEPPTIDEAHALGAVGQAQALDHADDEWIVACEQWVFRLPPGARFIAEDVVIAVEKAGRSTHNRKAIGPVIGNLARSGIIVKTGGARAARTSHGSLKPEWERR